jgi:hypothetical protein
MPNFDEHVETSSWTGCFVSSIAAFQATDPSLFQVAWESIGGYVAGGIGGRIADTGDPPWCGDHRDIFHALVPTTAVLVRYTPNLLALQQWCRDQASRAAQQMGQSPDPLQGFVRLIESATWYFAAGAIVGLPVGHATHLLQDSATPKGLPLICRGF